MEVNEAFNLLNIGRLDKRMIIRKLRQLAKAYDAETSVKVIGSSLTDVFFQLFENHLFSQTCTKKMRTSIALCQN